MKIFVKSFIIFCLPFIILIGLYIWGDPFKIIHDYDIYLSEYVMISRGFVSTEVFLKNNSDYDYDSFIFGSSRSTAFTCKKWEEYLPEDCSAFSYGAWNESIEGILRKIQLIDSMGNTIRNAIIVIDTDKTFVKSINSLDSDHYLISGKNFSQFHMEYFSNFLKETWLIPACIDYKLFGKRRAYMKGFIGMTVGDLDPINNDWLPNDEEKILKDSVMYYSGSINKFYTRPENERESAVQISANDSLRLQKIKLIFRKHNTNVSIIVGPLYDQIKLNKYDLNTLQIVFGKSNVFDFSGINYLTENIYNFKNDGIHYRNRTGNAILESLNRSQ